MHIEKHLSNGEEIKYSTRIHWLVFISPALIISLLFLLFSLFGGYDFKSSFNLYIISFIIMNFLMLLIDYRFTEIVCTNKRLFYKTGVFNINVSEFYYSKIEGINLEQTLIDTWIKRGSISITGTGNNSIEIKSIQDPIEFKNYLNKKIN